MTPLPCSRPDLTFTTEAATIAYGLAGFEGEAKSSVGVGEGVGVAVGLGVHVGGGVHVGLGVQVGSDVGIVAFVPDPAQPDNTISPARHNAMSFMLVFIKRTWR
jgi:hypothetical protein